VVALADPIAQLGFRPLVHPHFQPHHLSVGGEILSAQSAPENGRGLRPDGCGVRFGELHPGGDRRRRQTEHRLADRSVRAADGGGDPRFNRRAGVRLHPGAEENEILHYVFLPGCCGGGKHLRVGREPIHPDPQRCR